MVLILAHRGIHHKFKENTLKSIIQIFKYKTNKYHFGVELDVNLTKDNKIIIYHDEHIKNLKINNLNYDEIKLIDNDITLLEDVLIEFKNKDYVLNIELKEYPILKNEYCNLLINLLNSYKNVNYILSSFNQEICSLLNSKEINCYKIGSEYEYGEIQNYKNLNEKAIGVYTLFEKSFDENFLNKIININILITDDVDKLIKFLETTL